MTADDILFSDAVEQARLISSGVISADELIELSILRIAANDGLIGAVVHPRFERARAEVATVDPDAPFAGVPTLIKSTTPIADEPHDLGAWALARAGRRAAEDAPAVGSYRRAGLVVLGQSAAPEFALVSTTETRAHGVTRNPWDLARTSGGSSGGASAAVAAGYVPIAMGGDGGGSTRMPASFCNLVGLKPSRALIATTPGSDRWGHSVPGVLTRSIRDTAIMMDHLRSEMPGRLASGLPRHAFAESIKTDPRALRIGAVTNATTTGSLVDAEVDEAVHIAARAFADLGHHVEEAHPAALMVEQNTRFFFDALSVTATADIDRFTAEFGERIPDEDLDPITLHWDRRGRTISGLELATAFEGIARLTADLAEWWEGGYDILLSPVFPTPPRELGWPWRDRDGIQDSVDVLQFTAPFNSSGQPALALPVTFSAAGAPIGVQIVGALGSDALLLALGRQFEVARPWADKRPVLGGALVER